MGSYGKQEFKQDNFPANLENCEEDVEVQVVFESK